MPESVTCATLLIGGGEDEHGLSRYRQIVPGPGRAAVRGLRAVASPRQRPSFWRLA